MSKSKEVLDLIEGLVDKKYIFKGYKDLVNNYWGIDDKVKKNEFTTAPVVFLDEDPIHKKIMKLHKGLHEKVVDIKMPDGDVIKAFSLAADGGFTSFLFKVEDVDTLVKNFGKLEFVER